MEESAGAVRFGVDEMGHGYRESRCSRFSPNILDSRMALCSATVTAGISQSALRVIAAAINYAVYIAGKGTISVMIYAGLASGPTWLERELASVELFALLIGAPRQRSPPTTQAICLQRLAWRVSSPPGSVERNDAL